MASASLSEKNVARLRYPDKVTIVTGGTKGIGEGCVRVFGTIKYYDYGIYHQHHNCDDFILAYEIYRWNTTTTRCGTQAW